MSQENNMKWYLPHNYYKIECETETAIWHSMKISDNIAGPNADPSLQ